jgi:ribosomal protein S27E
MTCPSCNKEATTFYRHAFTLQGVSVFRSMQGYLTCQHCGTLLRVVMFKKQLWLFLASAFIIVLLFAFNFRSYIPKYGIDNMATIWVAIVVFLFLLFTIGMRKYSHVEKAE